MGIRCDISEMRGFPFFGKNWKIFVQKSSNSFHGIRQRRQECISLLSPLLPIRFYQDNYKIMRLH